MMRQSQREGSPIAIDLLMTPQTKRRHDLISRINEVCRPKNGPPCISKSPISKAFDFLPWSRHKKHLENTQKTEKKEENHHYKNLFKSGTSMREILGDKSNKNKPEKYDSLQRQNTVSAYRKIPKITRNTSLDLEELARRAEESYDCHELSKSWDDKESYLSDVYIKNILNNNIHEKDGSENILPKHMQSSKHILFNDENIVYLIRNEKPVHRNDSSKEQSKKEHKQQKPVEENNNSIYSDGNVVKARLKFKKVASQDDTTLINQQQTLNKPSILYRHNSFDIQMPPEDFPRGRSPDPTSEGSDGPKANKPRKKLSFREPIVSQKRNEIQEALARKHRASSQNLTVDNDQSQHLNVNNSHTTYDSDLESQAMLIVRTVGQAFEVCHKTNPNDQSSDIVDHDRVSDQCSDDEIVKKDPSPVPQEMAPLQRPNHLEIMPQTNSNLRRSPGSDSDKSPTSPISTAKEIQQLKELLEQQTLATRQTVAQLTLVKEQLISETKARIEAQVRTKQLLQQNRELLEYLVSLGGYVEPSQAGLTSANIALAPQSPLQMYLQDQPEMPSPIRKAFLSSSNNNNLTSISQHLNNLGSVNQQLSTLTQQLTGLNQQSQNLQNLQNFQGLNNLPMQTPNAFPALNQVQNMSNNVTNLSHANQDAITQNYQINQDLLNKLQNLNLGINTNSNANNNGQSINNNNSPNNSFIYANPGHLSSSPNNNSFNYLNSPNSMGNLTPSPMGTLNRNSFVMDDNLGLSIDKNLNNIDESSHFIKPLSQVGTLTTIDTDGKVKVIVPVSNGDGRDESSSSSSLNRRGGSDRKINVPNMVMLKVTDEQGNVTNHRKLAATPSFITRSTSEKVPNRSQMMSEVQRTQWARHTTK